MKVTERPSRLWIIWFFLGLLLPLFAVVLRMKIPAPPSNANPSDAPTVQHVVSDVGPQNRNVGIAEKEDEITDAALEEILKEVLSADGNGIESFLRTDYKPLSMWLDQRFEIELTSVSLSQIFDHVPLNDIYYELQADPARTTTGSFQASNISRRELLKRISDHWGLQLEINYGDNGLPTAIRATSR